MNLFIKIRKEKSLLPSSYAPRYSGVCLFRKVLHLNVLKGKHLKIFSNNKGQALVSVMIATTVGSLVIFGMAKYIVHLNQVSQRFYSDVNIAQAQNQIIATLTIPTPKNYTKKQGYESSCTKTFKNSAFKDKDKVENTEDGYAENFTVLAFTHLYQYGVGNTEPIYIAEYRTGLNKQQQIATAPDFLVDDEELTNIAGVYIRNFEIVSGTPRDNLATLRVTLRSPDDPKEATLLKKQNRTFNIQIIIKAYRSDNSSNPDYHKIARCDFYYSSQDSRQNKCKDADGNVVPGAPHVNGGGFVASTATVANTAFVEYYASVCDNAKVRDNAKIYDTARVLGSARVEDDAEVYGNARVYGRALVSRNAEVYGNAKVYGNARVYGRALVSRNAEVYGDARVYGRARVEDDAVVYHNARVFGEAKVYGNAAIIAQAKVYDHAQVYGDALVSRDGEVYGNAKVFGGRVSTKAKVYGNAKVYDNAKVYGNAGVDDYAQVFGDAQVYGDARVYGRALVSKDAQVYGNAKVYDNARVYGRALVSKDAEVYGNVRVYGNAHVSDYAKVYGNARVYDHAQVYGNARVYDHAQVYGNAKMYHNARVFGNAKVCGGEVKGERKCPDSEPEE